MQVTFGVLIILMFSKLEAQLKSATEWALPQDLGITYGDVIQRKKDSSLWIGGYKAFDILSISKCESYAKVVIYNVGNSLNDETELMRKVYPFEKSQNWDHKRAMKLLVCLASKKLRVLWFCRPAHWMQYVVTGKPIFFVDPWCPLSRDLTKMPVENICAQGFYLENRALWGERKIYLNLLKILSTL